MARRKTRKRGAGGRFVKDLNRRTGAKRSRRPRRNPVARARRRAAPRRNAYFMNPRRHTRRRARRNPPLFGGNRIMGISLKELAFAGAGFIAPPAIYGLLTSGANPIIPASVTETKVGQYAVKIGAVAAVSFAAGKFLGREAAKYIAIGGATYIVANLIVENAPKVFGGFGAYGYMSPGATFQAPRRLAAQPYMGMYSGIGTTPGKLPERVDPNQRF